MTKRATITKKAYETQTFRTGAPVRRAIVWIITDATTGRQIDTARTRKLANERARFAGYTV